MKTNLRTILRDIQAAARIGHIESLWAALEGLNALPQVAGNHPMDETFLNQVILPVGEAVAGARVNAAGLRPLSSHPNASLRAIAAAALMEQYLKGINGASLKDLTTLTQDPRQDVRLAISLAAARGSELTPEKLVELFLGCQPLLLLAALAFQ